LVGPGPTSAAGVASGAGAGVSVTFAGSDVAGMSGFAGLVSGTMSWSADEISNLEGSIPVAAGSAAGAAGVGSAAGAAGVVSVGAAPLVVVSVGFASSFFSVFFLDLNNPAEFESVVAQRVL